MMEINTNYTAVWIGVIGILLVLFVLYLIVVRVMNKWFKKVREINAAQQEIFTKASASIEAGPRPTSRFKL